MIHPDFKEQITRQNLSSYEHQYLAPKQNSANVHKRALCAVTLRPNMGKSSISSTRAGDHTEHRRHHRRHVTPPSRDSHVTPPPSRDSHATPLQS